MHDLTALTNRLKKVRAARKKWAQRAGLEAYRVYEEDIPELRYIVDQYGDAAVAWDRTGDMQREAPDYPTHEAIAAAIAAGMDLPLERVHLKRRRPRGAPGKVEQYEKLGGKGEEKLVREGDLKFLVNLTDFLDTGLFLDHRPLRGTVRAAAEKAASGGRPQRFLNLFCYTGSVSVAAAKGGAKTTSVDLSQTYLDWAKRNFAANDLGTEDVDHAFVRADVLAWLASRAKPGPRATDMYDVVYVDPPTFSNSKAMTQTFDVQRDHAEILRLALTRLLPGGVLWFSTNHSKFVLDPALAERAVDRTEATIPEDFRNRKIHRCYLFQG
jgi:23S rRNA G2069 N7-methylase RlmK/C1962 C5-methylase RlmI